MSEFEIRKSQTLKAFYTGGDYQLNDDATALYSTCGGVVQVVDVASAQPRYSVGEAEDSARVTSFALFNNAHSIIIAYTNQIIKHYRLNEADASLVHQFRTTHSGPVMSCLVLDDNNTLVTGSSDFSVKVWDLAERMCTRTFSGKSVVTALCYVAPSTLLVGYFDGEIRVFKLDQATSKPLEINANSSRMFSCSRITSITRTDQSPTVAFVFSCDRAVTLLDVDAGKALKTLPLDEIVEASAYIDSMQQLVAAGESGKLKFLDAATRTVVDEMQIASKGLDGIIYNQEAEMLVCSTLEQNLLFVSLATRKVVRQLAGHNDDVLDVCLLADELNAMAVATNSPQLKLYDLSTFSCSLVEGHSDNVMAVDAAEWDASLLASCSKDNSCLLWRVTPSGGGRSRKRDGATPTAASIAIATGHTNSVTCVRFSRHRTHPFVVTVSEDTTIKLWDLRPLVDRETDGDASMDASLLKLSTACTFVAHDKDVTCVEVSSNDKLCITGSLDKTAKLWHIDKTTMQLGAAGTLSGHRRGVWSVKFSNTAQTVATGSGDCTIKIFALSDLSCQTTLEGHTFAVLSVVFINNSTQLLSADSSGIIKAWDVKSGACQKTVEGHDDKVWALRCLPPSEAALERLKKRRKKAAATQLNGVVDVPLRPEEHVRYISAGSDGTVVVWEDVTEEAAAEETRVAAQCLAQVQTMDNFLRLGRYNEALRLALTLDYPHQCYKLLSSVLATDETMLKRLLCDLDEDQLVKLLAFASQWNTNTRTYAVAQLVLHLILRTYSLKRLDRIPGLGDVVKALLPYTKRHLDRLSDTQQDIAFLAYALSRMETLQPLPKPWPSGS